MNASIDAGTCLEDDEESIIVIAHEEGDMPRFYLEDFKSLEKMPSPRLLYAKLGDVIMNSTSSRASLESVDPQTGEYRVVLSGWLDLGPSRSRRW